VLLIPAAILPPVLLILVVHLDLQISQPIFDKILNDPSVIFRDLGKMIHEKNLKQKISGHCPFKEHANMLVTLVFVCITKNHLSGGSERRSAVNSFASM
jgi:hypothetical protein